MEQPPGSLDDLPHQSVSSSTVPSVIDLTRKEEECLLTSSSLDPLRRVKGSGWALSSSSTIPALQFSDTGSSDVTLRSGDQIQPDNALSHTTVTLSYVSRSHVFSTHSSPLYSVSPLSRFSLHPFEETSYALNQHYEEPVNLVTQAEPFPSFTQPQVGPEGDAREYDAREPPECNGRVLSSDGYEEETDSSILPDSRGCLENGGHDGWSNSMAPSVSPPEILRDEERGTSEALFTKAKKLDQVLSNSRGATDVCSVNREYKSPLEDPISPPSTPVDNVEDVFLLPQASSSPSADGCYLEAADDAARDTLSTDGTTLASSVVGPEGLESCDESTWSSHGPKAPLELSSDGPKAPLELSSDGSKAPLELSSNGPEASLELSSHGPKASLELSSHGPKASFELPSNGPEASLELLSHGPKASLELSSDGPKAPLELSSHGPKALLEASINSAKVACVSDDLENKTSCVPRINGNANVLERAIKERKLPMRSGRGTRLEAIVMNINSNRYKVSGCILTNKKPSASQPTAPDSAFPRSRRKSKAMSTFSAKTVRRKAVKRTKGEPRNVDAQSYNESTSVSELDKTETSGGGTPAKRPRAVRPSRKPVRPPRSNPVKSKRKPSSQPSVRRNSNTKPESVSVPKPSAESDASKVLPLRSTSKSAKNNQGGRQSKSPTKKTKASCTPKRRRKKPKRSQPSSMFSLKEPEIKLKYVNFKEEKRELRSDGFSPFVHVNRQHASSALCKIINYPEEAKTEPRRQHAHSRRFVSAVVPSTSCLQLGRSSTHGSLQRAFVCCLCGQSANSMDLGDLHGPYYPEGYRPNTKAPAHVSGLKEDEEDSSDSDSSCSNVRARRRAPLKQKGLLGSRKWVSSRIRSPAGKQARLDGSLADGEDWYSPPVLPGDPCEYWLHEDCGIWSAGVFLVKGKVYGLEEAVKVAQETTCSACRRPGATLGCFFKVCPNKYHYRCALESDCVLVEENFSMKCKKHKNKTLTAPPGSRRDDR